MAIKRINPELKTLLGDELYSQIETKLKDKDVVLETTEGYIPKERFDKVNDDLKDYKTKYESTNAEFEKLKPLAAGNEALTKKITELQANNEKTKTEYEAKIIARERDFAMSEALRGAKARNPKSVIGLLDHEKIVFKDGKLEGLEPQLETLKKSDAYLFDLGQQQKVDAFGKPIETNPNQTGGKQEKVDYEDPIAKAMGLEPKK